MKFGKLWVFVVVKNFLKSTYEDIIIDFREGEDWGKRERETERNIDWLPPVHAPT